MTLIDRLEVHAKWLGFLGMEQASMDVMEAAIKLGKIASDKYDGWNPDENELKQMMQNPRYWKLREHEFIDKVSYGFRKLYGED